MNGTDITKKENNIIATITSTKVSTMVDKAHKNLLRDIEGYIKVLEGSKLSSQDFFIKSSYKTKQGKEAKCYEVTRKGCDMIANKMIGNKGILFTAEYVTRFEEMEKELTIQKFNLPTNFKEALLMLVEAEEEKERLIESNKKKEELLIDQSTKIDLYEDFVNKDCVYSVNEIAKTLAIKGLGRNNFYKWLRDKKILIGTSYEAYQRYINSGYVVHRVSDIKISTNTSEGKTTKVVKETKAYFTTKGVEWLYKKLVKDDYIISKTLQEVMSTLIAEN